MMQGTYRIPEGVIADTRAFRNEVARFLAGELSPAAFRAMRVPMGIYEQRENGTYMVRVRGAAGVFLAPQILRVADLSERYASGVVHVTTRQDLQVHRVRIEDTPAVLESLLEVGLSSRGGGGNTVRNVTACRLAGACPGEAFDVTPHALALTGYLMANRANFALPRKFKVAFSGCPRDCALASIADLGFFAHVKDGVRGFAVYAGGGLGASPALALRLEEFIPEAAIFAVAEAVTRLFDRHGDRANRHRARLRFVVRRLGADAFRQLYQEELEHVDEAGLPCPEWPSLDAPQGFPAALGAARHPADTVTLRLALGDIGAAALRAVAALATEFGDGTVRATQDQDLQLRGVSPDRLSELQAALREVDERFVAGPSPKCVACAGASTCRLGICLSRGLAAAIESELRDLPTPDDAPLRISGCPNACGQHLIAPIGLQGGAIRADGRLVPAYSIFIGGRAAEGNAALARPIGKVPAKAVPALLREFWTMAQTRRRPGESTEALMERWGADALRGLIARYGAVPAYETAPDFYRDFGANEDFSLSGRGPGECGAGAPETGI